MQDEPMDPEQQEAARQMQAVLDSLQKDQGVSYLDLFKAMGDKGPDLISLGFADFRSSGPGGDTLTNLGRRVGHRAHDSAMIQFVANRLHLRAGHD